MTLTIATIGHDGRCGPMKLVRTAPRALFAVLASLAVVIGSCGGQRTITASPSPGGPSAPRPQATVAGAADVRVDVTAGHARGSFSPLQALGAGIDRMPTLAIDKMYSPEAL